MMSVAQVNWIREQIETPEAVVFSKEQKLRMLDRLCWSDHFEAFLAQKYATAKRFGLEGCEGLIVGMKELIDQLRLGSKVNALLGSQSGVVKKSWQAAQGEVERAEGVPAGAGGDDPGRGVLDGL